jgi:ribonuclease HI
VVERAVRMLEDWQLANNYSSAVRNPQAEISAHNSSAMTVGLQQGRNSAIPTDVAAGAGCSSTGQFRWQPPSLGRVKCNIDAAFSDQFNKTGIGICIRDEDGTFILAQSIPILPNCPVVMGEALALYKAIEWLSDMSFDSVDFCSDSKTITDAFNKNRVDVTETGYILLECRRLFTSHFTNSKVEFNRRQANEAAHILARAATFLASPTIHYHVPRCIENIIINEMI